MLDLLVTMPRESSTAAFFPSNAWVHVDQASVEHTLAAVAAHLQGSDAKRSTVLVPALDVLLEFISLTTFQTWLAGTRKATKGTVPDLASAAALPLTSAFTWQGSRLYSATTISSHGPSATPCPP